MHEYMHRNMNSHFQCEYANTNLLFMREKKERGGVKPYTSSQGAKVALCLFSVKYILFV
jgi:hypothetical protein